MSEIITISDASIVGTDGLKAGVQVWQKKIKTDPFHYVFIHGRGLLLVYALLTSLEKNGEQ